VKIGLIGPLPDPINGCSLANQTFLKYLVNHSYDVKTINTNIDVDIQGVQGEFSWSKLIKFIKVYLEILKVFGVDIIYMTPGQSFWGIIKYAPFIILGSLLNKPIVMHIHGNYLGTQYKILKGWKKNIFKFLISKATAGIVLSKSLKDNFKDLLNDEKIFIVENFANNELVSQSVLEKNINSLEILWLSNLMNEKGILDFFHALIILKQKNILFHAKIAGKIEEGLDSAIYSKLDELGDCVEYVGIVKGQEKIDLLKRANLFIFPTYYTMEGQPIALIEAMATGNIIITTYHAGIPDIINSTNGYLISPQDPDLLSKKIEFVSQNLHAEMKRISIHNQIYVKEKFTEQVFAEKILNVINNVHK